MNKDILKQGFFEFLEGGLEEENKSRFRLATTAYFKAITQLVDLIVFNRTGFVPKNHSERFRIIEKEDKALYTMLDSTFKMYQDTYSSPVTKETCRLVRYEIPNVIRFGELEAEFKKALDKIRKQNK